MKSFSEDRTEAAANPKNIKVGKGLIALPVLLVFFCSVLSAAGHGPADIVIYGRNFASVIETRTVELEEGKNEIVFPNLPGRIRPDSVALGFRGNENVRILEQRFVPPANEASLLAASEGEIIAFEISVDGATWTRKGKIIRAGRDPIVKINGKLIFGLPGKPMFEVTPEINSGPLLVFSVASPGMVEAEVELSYLTGGVGWSADYRAEASGGETLSLKGHYTIESVSGMEFEDARVALLAGDVSTAEEIHPRALRAVSAFEDSAPDIAPRELDEYHLYILDRPVTITREGSMRAVFLSAENIRAKREYVFEGARSGKVDVFLEFENSRENNLGEPLPGGRMKIFREEGGFMVMTGEDRIDHTSAGDKVRLHTGSAFDLSGERKQVDYRQTAPRESVESFEIILRNSKDEPSEVSVLERFRRRDWDIIEANLPHEKIDAETARFAVVVPPGGEAGVRYTVRTKW